MSWVSNVQGLALRIVKALGFCRLASACDWGSGLRVLGNVGRSDNMELVLSLDGAGPQCSSLFNVSARRSVSGSIVNYWFMYVPFVGGP